MLSELFVLQIANASIWIITVNAYVITMHYCIILLQSILYIIKQLLEMLKFYFYHIVILLYTVHRTQLMLALTLYSGYVQSVDEVLTVLPSILSFLDHDATHRSYFNNSRSVVVVDNVVCQGNEASLSLCDHVHDIGGISSCDNTEHAGVRCGGMYVKAYTLKSITLEVLLCLCKQLYNNMHYTLCEWGYRST